MKASRSAAHARGIAKNSGGPGPTSDQATSGTTDFPSRGRAVLDGAAWTYAAQLATVVVQLAYAALTSRLVMPDGFAGYAAAISVSGLVSLVTSGGVGQATARMVHVEKDVVRALVAFSLALGCIGGSFLYLTAGVWASVWGVDAATAPLKWLAIGAFLSPLYGLCSGLMTRLTRFRTLALITFFSNVCGMVAGSIAAMTWHSANALVVSPILSQTLLLIGCLFNTDRLMWGLASLRRGQSALSYSWKVVASNMGAYFSGNILKWSMTRAIAAATLGHWNRAETITLVPMQQAQGAMISAIFPEFRHEIGRPDRAKKIWTDMLVVVAWPSFVFAACGAVVIPRIVPLLFGAGWSDASLLAGPMAVTGGIQILATLLGSAIGALGRFRRLWAIEGAIAVVQASSAIAVFATHSLWLVSVALVVGVVVRHVLQVWLTSREGYLCAKRVARGYTMALSFSLILAFFCEVEIWLIRLADAPLVAAAAIALPILVVTAIYKMRAKLTPIRIAYEYKILRRPLHQGGAG